MCVRTLQTHHPPISAPFTPPRRALSCAAVQERFSIAQVTPFPWEDAHEVNAFVAELSSALAGRGHRVLVLAPSRSPELVRDSRRLIRAARERPEDLFDPAGGVRVLGVGELLPFTRRGQAPSPPVDVGRTVEEVLGLAPLDFVHVHEPFAPSTSSVALRHSRALNVGSFHAPTERVLSTQVARRFVELFFGRLDARTAAFDVTRGLMQRSFPAEYRLLRPGAAGVERAQRAAGETPGPLRIAFCAQEERAALRLFLRALRRIGDDADWEATIFSPTGAAPTGALRSRVRDRVRVVTAEEATEDEVLAEADVVVAASIGQAPAPGLIVRALGAGAVPVCARLDAYEELLGDGDLGLRFEPGDVDVLAAQLERLAREPELLRRLGDGVRGARDGLSWARVADDVEAIYARLAARRHAAGGRHAPAGAAAQPRADRRRPAHAHRPLARLRDAGRGAARDGPRARPRGDRGHRPQRDLRRAGRARQGGGVRREGDRRRGGQDRRPGRGDRPVHRGEDPARALARGDDRRDQAPGRARLRAAPVRPPALRARLRAPARGLDDSTRSRSSTRGSRSPPSTRRPCASRRSTGSSAARAPTPTSPQGLGEVRIRMRDFDGPEEFLESLRDAD